MQVKIRLWCAAAVAAHLLAVGCALSGPKTADQQAVHAGVERATERMRTLISAGEPSDLVRQEITAIRRELTLLPRTAVVPVLLRALHDGDDEFNSVLIHLLDDMDGGDWVPVRFRVRTMTIEAVVWLIQARATRAEQVDGPLGEIREHCSGDLAALVAAWRQLLESSPIYAWHDAGKMDVTDRVQGLALLGLIRYEPGLDLNGLLERVKHNRVTVPAPMLAQCLIHLSGRNLKQNLAQWLDGLDTARTAALTTVDLLSLWPPSPAAGAGASQVETAKAWVRLLPDDVTWRAVALANLKHLVEDNTVRQTSQTGQTGPTHNAAAAAAAAAVQKANEQLAWARRLLDVPGGRNPITWLGALPAANQLRALERLVGIDILVCPPAPAPRPLGKEPAANKHSPSK